MRRADLKFDEPQKISRSTLSTDYKNIPAPQYYERSCSVITEHGVVVTYDIKWETNTKEILFVIFTTVHKGLLHRATLEQGRLSDRNLKWMATHFIKKVLKK